MQSLCSVLTNGEGSVAEAAGSQIGLRKALTAAEEVPQEAPEIAAVTETEEIEPLPSTSKATEQERYAHARTEMVTCLPAIWQCIHRRSVGTASMVARPVASLSHAYKWLARFIRGQ
jgi:hypothetical protein